MRRASDIEQRIWEKELGEDEAFLDFDEFGCTYDSDEPLVILEEVDRQLKRAYGLEIVYIDRSKHDVVWKIEKVPDGEDKNSPLERRPWGDTKTP
jgi:hypothetical protein